MTGTLSCFISNFLVLAVSKKCQPAKELLLQSLGKVSSLVCQKDMCTSSNLLNEATHLSRNRPKK